MAAEVAIGNGYVQSKWVAEEILQKAASRTSLRPTIVRVGQICGGATGVWNSNEWFPLMVRSSTALQVFPQDHRVRRNALSSINASDSPQRSIHQDVDWIPVELAAKALCDFRQPDGVGFRLVHLVHPRPVPWSSIAAVVAQELSAQLVPYDVWLSKLEARACASESIARGLESAVESSSG